ncbi:MAG: inositol monophosphatase family protein [Candidatus Acidiferrales bacterium]
MNQFLGVAIEAAHEAGAILLSERDRPKKITYKGEVDLVTEADRHSEASVVARLRTRFPQHGIVAEEGSGGSVAAGAKYCWHIDPLDGTTNFAHGYPCYAVSIALLEDGEPVVGVVLNPVSSELFSAVRGEGAYLGQKRIHVSPTETISKSLLATGFPTHKVRNSTNIQYYWEYTLRSHGVRRDGSAALDLCSVACGRFDAFWEFGLRSWDTAAGILLVREAGGTVTDLSGRPYRAGDTNVLASNGLIHSEMQQVAADIVERAAKS